MATNETTNETIATPIPAEVRIATRWPSADAGHTEMQVRNGSVLIRRGGLWAEFMNGDYMGVMTEAMVPAGVGHVTGDEFKRWAPSCLR